MKAENPWAQGLNLNEDQILQWRNDAPPGVSFIFWLVSNQKIPADIYLEWARNHYGIPSLNTDFFSSANANEVFEKHKSMHKWSAEMFPVGEWEGIVYVACAEPIAAEWTHPVQFVLASPTDMQSHWDKISGGSSTQSIVMGEKTFAGIPPTPDIQIVSGETGEISKISQINEALADGETKENPEAPGETPKLELKFDTPEEPPPTEAPADAPEGMSVDVSDEEHHAPEGISAAAGEFKLDLSNLGPATTDDPSPTKDETQKTEAAPAEIETPALSADTHTLEGDEPALAPTEPMDDLVTQSEANKEPTETEPAPTSEDTGGLKIEIPKLDLSGLGEGSAPKLDLPEAPEGVTPELPKDATAEGAIAPPPLANDNVDAPKSQALDGAIQTDTAPLDLTKATSESDVTAFVFKELKKDFQQCMVLHYKDEKLIPWKWDETWKPSSESIAKESVDLSVPSAFRIVHRTKLPYHGHVVDSEYNQKFFKSWGLDAVPETLTLIPLKQGEFFVFGVLLCTSAKDKNDNSTLVSAERQADELLTAIGKVGKGAA